MRFRALLVVTLALSSFSLAQQLPAEPEAPRSSEIGLMIPVAQMAPETRVELAKSLGAKWYRPMAIFLDRGLECAECDAAAKAGLKLSLVIRNGGDGGRTPSRPPSDLREFEKRVAAVLDRYKPSLLVVENEQDNAKLFYSGMPAEYAEELATACKIAKQKSVDCAAGGITGMGAIGVVLDELWRSDQTKAIDFAVSLQINKYIGERPMWQVQGATIVNKRDLQQQIEKALSKFGPQIQRARAMLEAANNAGVSRTNFHWYWAHTQAIPIVVETLRKIGGRPVMCDEAGMRQNSPGELMDKLEGLRDAGVAPIIWFSADMSGDNGAVGLTEKDGRPRPAAQAFKRVALQSNTTR